MIKYLGSKRLLLPQIVQATRELEGVVSVLDLFSGTSRVGHALKGAGFRVLANDHTAYAHTLAQCYVAADLEDVAEQAHAQIATLQAVADAATKERWFTRTYAYDSRFFRPEDAARIEAVRDAIDNLNAPEPLRSVLLVSLLEAADRVDSTTGVQMAYLKQWAARASKPLTLRMPNVLPRSRHGACRALGLDANVAAAQEQVDLVYLDPPYNQHSYLGNYHVWETLVRWDEPEVYGIAMKRIDVRTRQSPFNSKRKAAAALDDVLRATRSRYLMLSFNDEGYLSEEELRALLAPHGEVNVQTFDFPRYVGAKIGIYNPAGEKVGRIQHTRNCELLFVVRR